MGNGNNIICVNDGDGIHRVCIAMGANVILGGDSDNELINSDTVYRGGHSTMALRGL